MSEDANVFRVFVETNVMVSAIVFPSSISRKMVMMASDEHELVLCSYTISEIFRVIEKRFPEKIALVDEFLSSLKFELVYTPHDFSKYDVPEIRDDEDIPILVSALIAEPDLFVTGDKDFLESQIKNVLPVYSPGDFIRDFGYE